MGRRCHLALLGAMLLLATSARADLPRLPANAWVTGRPVRAAVRAGDRVFVGGDFVSVYPASRFTGSLASFAHGREEHDARPSLWGEDAQISAVADDGNGGWFAGGNFTHAGPLSLDSTGPQIVHLHRDGTVRGLPIQPPPGTSATAVTALARAGPTLLIAYQSIRYSGRLFFIDDYIAPFETATDTRLAPDIAVNSRVTAMAADDSRIYVFGYFSAIGGATRSHAAAVDAASLTVTTWAPDLPVVSDVDIDQGTLYLTGPFTTVAGQPRQGLAAIAAADGALLPWAPTPPCPISAVAAASGVVYLGGCGPFANGVLTAVDSTTGASLGWSAAVDGEVKALGAADPWLYVGGSFSTVAGESRLNAAAFSNRALAGWNPRPSEEILAVAATADLVAIGGRLTGLGAIPRSGLAEFDATTGGLMPTAPAAFTGWGPRTLATDGRYLFVRTGGIPCSAGDSRCHAVAVRLDDGSQVAIPRASEAMAIAAAPNRLYVGYDSGLAAYDTASGTQLPWQLPLSVRHMVATDTALYVIPFESTPGDSILKVDARTGMVLPWGPVTTAADVGTLVIDGPWLLAGLATGSPDGSVVIAIDHASGAIAAAAPRSLIPSLDFDPTRRPFSPLINPASEPLTAGLAVSPRGILAASGGLLLGVTRSSGSRLDWSVGFDGPVPTLYADDRVVVAGGVFSTAGGAVSPGLAIFPEVVPQAPTNVSAIVQGTSVRLDWTRPADGDPIDYQLEAGSRSGAADLAVVRLPPATTVTVANVAVGRYFVRVRAATSAGLGPASNEVEVVVGTPAPLAPTGLAATVAGRTVSLMWTAVTGPVDRYVLDVGSRPGQSDLVRGLSLGLSTAARFEDVPAGHYFIRIRASNQSGSSPPSAEVTVAITSAPQRTR